MRFCREDLFAVLLDGMLLLGAVGSLAYALAAFRHVLS